MIESSKLPPGNSLLITLSLPLTCSTTVMFTHTTCIIVQINQYTKQNKTLPQHHYQKIIIASKIISIMEIEPSEINWETKTVHIRKGDENNSIPDEAFKGYEELESVHIEDGAKITSIGDNAFSECQSLESINIPIGVTTIGAGAFGHCSSLQSINIPKSVTDIEWQAFWECTSLRSINIPMGVKTIGKEAFGYCELLQSIHIPNTVETVEEDAFVGCDALQQRLKNGTNYHSDINTWLRQRFDNLPIHEACYYANNNDDAQSAVDHLSTIVQENKQTLVATDAMGMTPLHILCCNPNITAEMVRVIVEQGESSSLIETDVTESTPMQLFMRCRGYLPVDEEEEEEPSLCDLLEKGIEAKDLAILFALNDNQQIDMSGKDEETGLFPFMSAAVLPGCGLDVVFTLAMNNLDDVVSSTQNLKTDAVSNEYEGEVKRRRID